MLESLLEGMSMVLTLDNFGWAAAGVAVGIVFGAIPGLTDTMAVVLFLPFTFYLSPIAGIAMLMGLCKGGNFGGSIPAILFNIPGTPQAMVTCFDGYPLARQGKSGKALNMALLASCLADAASDLILIFLAAPVALVALKIGPPEYSMIIFFSIVIIAVVSTADPLRGLISTGLGLFLAVVGMDPEYSTPRLTYGIPDMLDGFNLMPMVIGLLAFSEVLRQIEVSFLNRFRNGAKADGPDESLPPPSTEPGSQRVSGGEFRTIVPTLLRSTGIGSLVGIIPGIGTTVGSYLSYILAQRCSKTPEAFGKGSLEGITASEAGNNAVNGPNLIPLVTLGIPGNLAAALVLGGFMIKGLTPGPRFMESHASLLYALFTVLFLSNIFTFAFGKLLIPFCRHLVRISRPALYTGVLIFSVIGAYISNSSLFDVGVMFAFGILGYLLARYKFNLPSLVVAFFLGQLFEHKVRQSITLSGGDFTIFLTRPISLCFLVMTIGVVVFYMYRRRANKTMVYDE